MKIFLSVKSYLLGFNFTVLYFDFVSTEDDGDVLTDTSKISAKKKKKKKKIK